MPPAAETLLRVVAEATPGWDAARLPSADPCATLGWYRATASAALPEGGAPLFVHVLAGDALLAVFPMLFRGTSLAALTTPYTVSWQPLLAPGLTDPVLRQVGQAFGAFCGRHGCVRLDCLDEAAAWSKPIAAGLRAAGRRILAFDHFGNWRADTGQGWPAYLAARPGALREAIRRRGKRLMQGEAARFELVCGGEHLGRAIAAFEDVYARSWKEPEPSPRFNATLARECAADGTLRLGVLSLGADTLAVQFWVARGGTATVLKLAHDEAARAHSPGTVLTALMIQRLIEQDGARTLDFGRGDDAYKQMWCDARLQRTGWLLADPRRLAGLAAIGRHLAGRARRRLRRVTSGTAIPRSVASLQGDKQ